MYLICWRTPSRLNDVFLLLCCAENRLPLQKGGHRVQHHPENQQRVQEGDVEVAGTECSPLNPLKKNKPDTRTPFI